jgi:hypothetical protein
MKRVWVLTILVSVPVLLGLAYLLLGGFCTYGCNRDSRRIYDIRQIQNALDRYFQNCGVYPGGTPKPGSDPSCTGISRPSQLGGEAFYGHPIPKDPVTGADYAYCYTTGGSSFALQARLGDTSNPAFTISSTAPPPKLHEYRGNCYLRQIKRRILRRSIC